jgi:predicted NBD/HSP70 family sugar kinase
MTIALGRNHKEGKLYNRALILRLILNRGPVSRLSLSRLTRLSPAALTILTGELIEEGLLVETEGDEENGAADGGTNRVGRKSTPLDFNPYAARTLGVNITPHLVRVGLLNLKGEILDQEMLGRADYGAPEKTLGRIAESSKNIMARNGLTSSGILGMGVGAVGLVEARRGINIRALSLGWANVSLKEALEHALSIPVNVDNNVRGMALAESLFGYGRTYQFQNIAVVYVGTGIGCGLVVESELYRGSHDAAGEIGHMVIDMHGEECYCGARGCLETLAGEQVMLRSAQREVQQNPAGGLAQLVDGNTARVDIEHLLQAANNGDPAASNIVERAGEALGLAVVNLVKTVSPDTVILAGRVPRNSTAFNKKISEALRRSSAPPGSEIKVVTTSLDDNIGLVGAAALALREFFYSPVSIER